MSWILTYTGKKVDPLNLTVDDIDIEDIAHALSNQCRFSGHVRKFISVAEHSIIVEHILCKIHPDLFDLPQEQKRAMRLAALLHDASEAYLVDIPRPVKESLPDYKQAEHKAMRVIEQKFKLPEGALVHPWVKEADDISLVTEGSILMHADWSDWGMNVMPFCNHNLICCYTPEKAKVKFLAATEQSMELKLLKYTGRFNLEDW